ncbi:MAG: D-TA family PLP-dependent enzyme, partial [Spirochaetota bacterium]
MQPSSYRVADAASIPSPALLYFRPHVGRNIAEMIAIAGDPRRLRPHVKTFKTMGVVHMIRRHG